MLQGKVPWREGAEFIVLMTGSVRDSVPQTVPLLQPRLDLLLFLNKTKLSL